MKILIFTFKSTYQKLFQVLVEGLVHLELFVIKVDLATYFLRFQLMLIWSYVSINSSHVVVVS